MDSSQKMSLWLHLPDNIILCIFTYLNAKQLLSASSVCRCWYRVAQDHFLWRDLVACYLAEQSTQLESSNPSPQRKRELFNKILLKGLPPGGRCWKAEYKRLHCHTPVLLSETVAHENEVWHVSFSNRGDMFASCCKGGYFNVWSCVASPAVNLFSTCMGQAPIKWNDTFMSQFSEDDKLLLVTGDKQGSYYKGDVAIFDVENGFSILRIVPNSPYDVFGTWFSKGHILVGNLHILGYPRGSVSELKVVQVPNSKEEPLVVKKRFIFRNIKNFVRCVVIADCIDPERPDEVTLVEDMQCKVMPGFSLEQVTVEECMQMQCSPEGSPDVYSPLPSEEQPCAVEAEGNITLSRKKVMDKDKLLIFTWGHKSSDLPHEIAIKRLSADMMNCAQEDAEGDTVQDAMNRPVTDVDHVIDLAGHIVGLRLSQDQRYLYANCRPISSDGSENDDYPTLDSIVMIHVIDLLNMSVIRVINTRHKGFTQEAVFYLYLDVSKRHILSGSEDKMGYLWDRHYEVQLSSFQHMAPVCCAALNPRDEEMLATASDDHTLKLWRSRHVQKSIEGPRHSQCRDSSGSMLSPRKDAHQDLTWQ